MPMILDHARAHTHTGKNVTEMHLINLLYVTQGRSQLEKDLCFKPDQFVCVCVCVSKKGIIWVLWMGQLIQIKNEVLVGSR